MLQATLQTTPRNPSNLSITLSSRISKSYLTIIRRNDNQNPVAEHRHTSSHWYGKGAKVAKEPHCLDFRVFKNQVTPPEKQVEAAVTEEQQRQEWIVGIEMRKLNHFINKSFANGFCVLKYRKINMYVTYLPLFWLKWTINFNLSLRVHILRATKRRLRLASPNALHRYRLVLSSLNCGKPSKRD